MATVDAIPCSGGPLDGRHYSPYGAVPRRWPWVEKGQMLGQYVLDGDYKEPIPPEPGSKTLPKKQHQDCVYVWAAW